MGAVVSSLHVVSATPSSSGGGLLTLCPCSNLSSLPQETVLHKLLQRESLPRVVVLQEQASPVWVTSHRVTSPAIKSAPVWAPLSMGPQVLPGACSIAGSPWSHSLLWASTCSGMGSSMGCWWKSAPPWTSMGCRGTTCITMAFSTVCRGISVLASGAPFSPSFTDLGVHRVVSHTYSHSSIWLQTLFCSNFPPAPPS